jgi:hypothetical protein
MTAMEGEAQGRDTGTHASKGSAGDTCSSLQRSGLGQPTPCTNEISFQVTSIEEKYMQIFDEIVSTTSITSNIKDIEFDEGTLSPQ